jgi:hypothetical protein
MKKVISILLIASLIACNNSKKESKEANGTTSTVTPDNNYVNGPDETNKGVVTYTVDGAEIKHVASLLVQKDEDKLQAGLPYLCVLTSNAAPHNNEYLNINFLLDTKPGDYPIVGSSLQRGTDPNNEIYGGILGGKPTITNDKVHITECTKIGDHKWKISGTSDDLTIKAMGVMLMDKSRNHPQEIKISGISFSNLTFDDNFTEMMEKAAEMMKKK